MEAGNHVNLIGALALYQNRRDTAIGLTHVTQRQQGLLWYYSILSDKQRRNIETYVRGNVILKLIKHGNALKRRARRTKDPQKQLTLMAEAASILAQVEQLENG